MDAYWDKTSLLCSLKHPDLCNPDGVDFTDECEFTVGMVTVSGQSDESSSCCSIVWLQDMYVNDDNELKVRDEAEAVDAQCAACDNGSDDESTVDQEPRHAVELYTGGGSVDSLEAGTTFIVASLGKIRKSDAFTNIRSRVQCLDDMNPEDFDECFLALFDDRENELNDWVDPDMRSRHPSSCEFKLTRKVIELYPPSEQSSLMKQLNEFFAAPPHLTSIHPHGALAFGHRDGITSVRRYATLTYVRTLGRVPFSDPASKRFCLHNSILNALAVKHQQNPNVCIQACVRKLPWCPQEIMTKPPKWKHLPLRLRCVLKPTFKSEVLASKVFESLLSPSHSGYFLVCVKGPHALLIIKCSQYPHMIVESDESVPYPMQLDAHSLHAVGIRDWKSLNAVYALDFDKQ